MEGYTREEILRLILEEDVQFIRMQFTDLFGQLKNVAITASQIERALDGEIMLDGSSIQGSVRVEESDQYLKPDLNTFAILPWRPQYGKVARMICNVHNPDGSPFAGDPRNVLKQALQTVEDMGLALNVGPELEFFLFLTDEEGNPSTRTADRAGYFDLGPLDHGESTRRDGNRGGGQSPRGRCRTARDRPEIRGCPYCRRQHYDSQTGCEDPGSEERTPRHLHAKAPAGCGGQRDAYQPLSVP